MKRNLLFMSVLASLFMAGCSQDDIALDEGGNGNGEANTSYLAVNLVSSDVTGSRATGGDYEDGSEKENGVKHVRFYFFNGVGAAVNVKTTASGAVNYHDWDKDITGSGNPNDVERILSAVIVINTNKGDGIPVRIAAVLNPTPEILSKGSMSLTALKALNDNYAATGLTTNAGDFVMFNSVYVQDGKDYSTTDIKDGNICKTEDEAKANPVTIYVERSVAKVSVALGPNVKDAADGKIALKDKVTNGENLLVEGKQVYLKLNGWDLAAETDKGRLVKKINPGWQGTWWNDKTTGHRTFWAINEMSATNLYDKNYSNIKTAFGNTNWLYTNENAQTNDDVDGIDGQAKKKTKVIVSGRLVDENDNNFTIVRHMGRHFADEPDNFNNLKESILIALENKEYFYYYKDGEHYKQISAADLDVVEPTTTKAEDSENCYVYTQLNSTAYARTTWYKSAVKDPADASAYTKIDADEINGILKNKKPEPDSDEYIIDRPLVWNSGMTYYYYEIKHLQGSDNTGVVRNHIYKTTITNIAGFGTPVYDPNDIIYPEKPEDNAHYIAAEINILSWRVVNNNYDLEW